MVRLFRVAALIAGVFTANAAFAACHAVTPGGTGAKNGTSWSNAYAGLPATLTRGDIYYLSDGNFGAYNFNTTDSGSTTVEIRKAQTYDFGNTCGIGTGWNAATMGAAQAVMTSFTVITDYVIVNGNGTQTAVACGGAPGLTVSAPPPNPIDCGIKLDNSSGGGAIYLGNINTGLSGTHATFEYIEEEGSGINATDQIEIEGSFNAGAGANATFTHNYLHNAGCVYMEYGGDSRVENFNYFWGTEIDGAPGGTCHGQAAFFAMHDSNGVIHGNVYRDITGTAIWTFALPAGSHTGWVFYDNVVLNSATNPGWSPFTSDGVLACINSGVNCTGFSMYQNTFINLNSGSVGINNENTGSYTVRNNIWYGGGMPTFNTGSSGSYTQDHNSYLVSGTSCPSGTSNVCSNSSTNPFSSLVSGVFSLASDSANWNNRIALGGPYDTDAAGNTFTSDRGAYQFAGTQSQAPQPPTNLVAVTQ
jgi:hypothetical protein